MTARARCARFAAVVLVCGIAGKAVPLWAHDARPLSVMIVEGQPRAYRVVVRVPPSVEADNRPGLSWPEGCVERSSAIRQTEGASVETLLVSCRDGLEGRSIGVRYELFNPSLATLFRFTTASGVLRTAVLPPEQKEWRIPLEANWRSVAVDYFVLGVEHIWAGIDHLLFVAGLLVLARTPRRILIAVTGFTAAHSVTLSLSALDLVRLPLPPIEAGIALSILFLAAEIARPAPDSLARRYPLTVSSLFGLLHGFGFAAALSEAGLPQREIATALLFFNAGVEAGQVVFIAVALIALAALTKTLLLRSWPAQAFTPDRAEGAAAYVLGIPAAFWFFERLQGFWAG